MPTAASSSIGETAGCAVPRSAIVRPSTATASGVRCARASTKASERAAVTRYGPAGERVERGPEVLLGLRLPRAHLGEPELEPPGAARLGRGRLGERATQIRHRRLRRARRDGGARRGGEPVDHPGVARRLRGEQVLGRALGGGGVGVEQLGRLPVSGGAVGARELPVDGGADDRVREGERAPRLEDPGRHELVRRRDRGLRREAGERGRLGHRRALEHRDRARQPPGGRVEAARAARRIQRATVRAPWRSTSGADPATGRTPSSRSATSSWLTRNGMPRVARTHASANAGSGGSPRPACTSAATPSGLSGAGCRTVAAGSAARPASTSRAGPWTSGRVATTSASGSSSSRVTRKTRKRSDEASAQWASSTASTSGRRTARFAHSQ